jgi:phosphoglycerate dehydrogenase-like enzyme
MSEGSIVFDPYPRSLDLLFDATLRRRLERLAPVVWHDGPAASDEHIERHLPDAVALVGQTALPAARLAQAPKLRCIVNIEGNLLPNIDYDEAFRRGIRVLNAGSVFAVPVAEMALGLALAGARHIVRGDNWLRAGSEVLYDEGVNEDSFLLADSTVGIVGLGAVGRAIRRLLSAFGCPVLGHDPWLPAATLHSLGVEPSALPELFSRSRVVFLASAPTTENEAAIDASVLRLLPRGAVVVLVARAAIVAWDDLLDAAESGHIRAAIDVFPVEPIAPDARVRRVPNTIISAHRAGNIPWVWPRMGEMVVDDLELVLSGLPPQRCQVAQPETAARMRGMPVG